jgi:hypothetical protein
MSRRWILVAVVSIGCLAGGMSNSRAQNPAETPGNRENIEAALKLTQAAAAEYEIRVGDDDKPLDLQREPVLRWSNPEAGQVHGNVYLWTRDGRPQAAGCLFNWFSPPAARMEHEFHSFAEGPLSAKFHGNTVWKTSEPGVRFSDVPGAAAPAANEAQRLLQLKQLAKEFSGAGKFPTNASDLALRLLPQPIHRYSAPKQGIITGGLFAFVRGTDPEIFLLIEARGKDAASVRWQFGATRMHSMARLWLRHQDKQIWSVEPLPLKKIFETHALPYTAFKFKEVPDFLKDAVTKPKQ